jgi:hypothetical protein
MFAAAKSEEMGKGMTRAEQILALLAGFGGLPGGLLFRIENRCLASGDAGFDGPAGGGFDPIPYRQQDRVTGLRKRHTEEITDGRER